MKTVRHIFFMDTNRLERWLCHMSSKGYHLVGVHGMRYTFEECPPDEYEYRVEFAGVEKGIDLDAYEAQLTEIGYSVLRKPTSLGQKSIGKIRLNAATGEFENRSTFSTNSQVLSIFIISRKRVSTPFITVSSEMGRRLYYSRVRNMFLVPAVLLALLVVFGSTRLGFVHQESVRQMITLTMRIIAGAIGLGFLALGLKAQYNIGHSRQT